MAVVSVVAVVSDVGASSGVGDGVGVSVGNGAGVSVRMVASEDFSEVVAEELSVVVVVVDEDVSVDDAEDSSFELQLQLTEESPKEMAIKTARTSFLLLPIVAIPRKYDRKYEPYIHESSMYIDC